jgi:16S rRNA (cytidine1402-2'-O)-methyltransferase
VSAARTEANRQGRGTLWLVATPIGNLGDLSPRALETLKGVDGILCEDTRTSATLLRHFGISKPLRSLHQHNESEQAEQVISLLAQGATWALISDAGTPLISDPGFPLVRAARAAGHRVFAVPGACALVYALSVSGIAADRFCFEGFLPTQSNALKERLSALIDEPRSMVFYEAPHRLHATLEAMRACFGGARPAFIAREISKVFETHYVGTLDQLVQQALEQSNMARGELVLVLAGAPAQVLLDAEAKRIHDVLKRELKPALAAKLAAKITGLKKSDFYNASEDEEL